MAKSNRSRKAASNLDAPNEMTRELIAVGDFLNSRNLTAGAALEVLLTLSADALAAIALASDPARRQEVMAVNIEKAASALRDIAADYLAQDVASKGLLGGPSPTGAYMN